MKYLFLIVLLSGCSNIGADRFIMPADIVVSDEIDMALAHDVVEYLIKNERSLKSNDKNINWLDFNKITTITKVIVFTDRAEKLFPGINSRLEHCIMSVNWEEAGLGKTAVCIGHQKKPKKGKYSAEVYYSTSH